MPITRSHINAAAVPLLALAAILVCSCAASSKPSPHSGNGIRLLSGDWTLQSIEGRALPESVQRQSRPPNLSFSKDGKVTGFSGVNQLSSSVDVDALDDNTVIFAPFISTRMAGPPEAMDVESRFTAALARVNRYLLDGLYLVLLENNTELLRLHSRPPPGYVGY